MFQSTSRQIHRIQYDFLVCKFFIKSLLRDCIFHLHVLQGPRQPEITIFCFILGGSASQTMVFLMVLQVSTSQSIVFAMVLQGSASGTEQSKNGDVGGRVVGGREAKT